MKKLILIILILPSIGYAQFEKKLTFDFSVGYAIPTGDELKEDRLPHFFSNMGSGIAFLADFQYNFDEHFSVGLQAEYTQFFSWTDPRAGSAISEDNSQLNIYNINPFARYRILKGKISPIVIGSIGLSLYNGERAPVDITLNNFFLANPDDFYVSIDQVVLREPGESISTQAALNTVFGVGADYNLSQSLGFFVTATYNTVFTNNDEVLRQNMNYPLISLGVNVNFVKSKTL